MTSWASSVVQRGKEAKRARGAQFLPSSDSRWTTRPCLIMTHSTKRLLSHQADVQIDGPGIGRICLQPLSMQPLVHVSACMHSH